MITDWDDAYANAPYVEAAEDFDGIWTEKAAAFRDEMTKGNRARIGIKYGRHEREAFDLFLPEGKPKGLAVYIHGGYWLSRDRSLWSHFAAGAVARGWAMAVPGYVLCPEVRIADITRQITSAIDMAANEIDGPIHIAGHSAGGHLAARMGCTDVDLKCADRVKNIVAISGVHDLRPMLSTEMNRDFKLTPESAVDESPALLTPRKGFDLTCWVGADERPEFLRQNALLANVWTGFGMNSLEVRAKGKNHFTVIDDLIDPQSVLCDTLLG